MTSVLQGTCALDCACNPSLGCWKKKKFCILCMICSVLQYDRTMLHVCNIEGTHIWNASRFYQEVPVVILKVQR